MSLKDQINEGKVSLPMSELRGFEQETLTKPDRIKPEEKKALNRANAAKRRQEVKELEEKKKAFEMLKLKLQKEGKL